MTSVLLVGFALVDWVVKTPTTEFNGKLGITPRAVYVIDGFFSQIYYPKVIIGVMRENIPRCNYAPTIQNKKLKKMNKKNVR